MPCLRLPAIVLILLCGCRKNVEANPAQRDSDLPTVEQQLQLVEVRPGSIETNTSVKLTVLGAGFEGGTAVYIGEAQLTGTRFIDQNTMTAMSPELSEGVYDVSVIKPNYQGAVLRGGLRVATMGDADISSCDRVTVFFDVDQSALSSEARAILDRHVGCYNASGLPVRLEGHADERGTTDYNLALGQRRAESVRAFLIGEGVSAGRVAALSLGEERPADTGHGPGAWAKNRRVELYYR